MKPLIYLSFMLVAGWTSDSFAQRDDTIEVWADDDRAYCALSATPGIRSVHMFHVGSQFATASRFSVPKPACWTGATWIADRITPPFLALGDSQSDLSIAYVGGATGCTPTPIYLGAVDFLVTAPGPSCCRVEAKPPASEPAILIVDCLYQEFEASAGGGVVVNPTTTCPCSEAPPGPTGAEIALYADTGMSSCVLVDDAAGVRSVYIFHTGSPETTASQFAAPLPSCWTGATFLSDRIEAPFLAIGNSQSNLSIAYTHCLQPPLYLGRIDFYSTGIAPSCCELQVTPAAGEPGIWVADCQFEPHMVGPGAGVTINPTADCPCGSEPPVAVEATTWGRVKALYRGR